MSCYSCDSWVPMNWCFRTVVLEETLETPLDSKEIQPVHPKGNQSWTLIRRTDAEAETPILWPPDMKNWLIGKDPDAGKDWRQEEKGMTEDEMVGWHHWLNGHELELTPGVGGRQGGLVCCSPWGHKELDTTEWNWTELNECHFPVSQCLDVSLADVGGLMLARVSHHVVGTTLQCQRQCMKESHVITWYVRSYEKTLRKAAYN